MRVLIACEFSGVVREAFTKRGHEAWSCDLLPSEIEGKHIQGDVLKHLTDGWDLMIAHPPCTYLCVSGLRWIGDARYPDRERDQEGAIVFVEKLWGAPIPKVAIENPVGILSSKSNLKRATQTIEPFYFGHNASKKTCLWLRGLPKLRYGGAIQMSFDDKTTLSLTAIVKPDLVTLSSGRRMSKWYVETSRVSLKNGLRGRIRSRTFQGIADAMAEQWG